MQRRAARLFAVALEAAVATADTMPHLVGRAHRGAMAVAGSLDSDALDDELAAMLGAAANAAASASVAVAESDSSVPTEADEEEDEEEEEAGFGGLGDLFG